MTFTDILSQVRTFMGVDSTRWSTQKITYSVNNWLDTVTGYAIGADRRFQWDDTNHTKLPIGTTDLVASQDEYSFLTDEQGNRILTLTRIDVKNTEGNWYQLTPIDQANISPQALDEFMKEPADPLYYDKISDNVIRLYPPAKTGITAGLKFYFQRSPSYFAITDTTKEPGVASTLHRGAVIAAALDGAISLGLPNLNAISIENEKENQKMVQYFTNRNKDEVEITLRGKINYYK